MRELLLAWPDGVASLPVRRAPRRRFPDVPAPPPALPQCLDELHCSAADLALLATSPLPVCIAQLTDRAPFISVYLNGFEGLNLGAATGVEVKNWASKIGGASKSKVGALIWVPLLELL
jgi:hypothetical protein